MSDEDVFEGFLDGLINEPDDSSVLHTLSKRDEEEATSSLRLAALELKALNNPKYEGGSYIVGVARGKKLKVRNFHTEGEAKKYYDRMIKRGKYVLPPTRVPHEDDPGLCLYAA